MVLTACGSPAAQPAGGAPRASPSSDPSPSASTTVAASPTLTPAPTPSAVALPSASAISPSKGPALFAPQVVRTSGEPFGVAIDAQGSRAYVADTKENTLFVFDLASGTPLAYIPTGRQPGQVVLLGARLFVSNFADGSLTVIDTSTNRPLKTLLAGGLGLALNGQSRRLYAAAGSRVVVLDPTTDTLVATLPVPPGANVWGLAVDPVANRVYATDLSSPRVLVYDGATNTLAAQIGLDAPGRLGIAVGPSGRVFVAGDTDTHAQLAIIDGAAAKVVARVPIPGFTRSLAVDPGGLVYAASGADGSVTAVDPVGGTASTVSVPQDAGRVIPPSSAKAVAISPTTGVLVIAASGGAAPPARPFVDPVPVIRL